MTNALKKSERSIEKICTKWIARRIVRKMGDVSLCWMMIRSLNSQKQEWNKVIREGLKHCGYVKDQKVTSIKITGDK